jgi:hypothetical protein
MSRAQHLLIPLVSLVALAAFQIPAFAQKLTTQAIQIVHPAAGKGVTAVQSQRRNLDQQAAPKFLSWGEKVVALKAMNLYSGGGGTPATSINLTVLKHVQTVNGVYAAMSYIVPMNVISDDYGTGVASFGNSTKMYDGTWNDPTLEIRFKPLPNKQYLFDAGMYGNTGTYYIYVHVDNNSAFQQIMPNANRLLIFFPGTAKPQESYIAIRGSIPGRGYWSWYGCQITEL